MQATATHGSAVIATATATVPISVVIPPPEITVCPASLKVPPGALRKFTVGATANYGTIEVKVAAGGSPAHGTLTAGSGTDSVEFTYTAGPDEEQDSITIQATAALGTAVSEAATQTIPVTITNSAALHAVSTGYTLEAWESNVTIALQYTGGDGTPVTFSIEPESGPNNGGLDITGIGSGTVAYLGEPSPLFGDGFRFKVKDGSSSDTGQITIQKNPLGVIIVAHSPGTKASPGAVIPGDTAFLQANNDNDDEPGSMADPPPKDNKDTQTQIGPNDNDIVKIQIYLYKYDTEGTFVLNIPSGVRVFKEDGTVKTDTDLDTSVSPIVLYVEGLDGFTGAELSATYSPTSCSGGAVPDPVSGKKKFPPVEILIPELKKSAFDDFYETEKLVGTTKLAIATLENSFRDQDDRPLKDDSIEADWDRFYIRVTDPSHSGKGPYRVRVWTNTPGVSGYDDDDRTDPAFSQIVELTEKGNTGVFTSESMLLHSNDGDNSPFAFVKRRGFKIGLGGKLKVELLEHKAAATYNADIEAEVPVEKTVKIKVFVATKNGVQVTSNADIDTDLQVLQETMAQAGVKIVRTGVVQFTETDAGIDLSDGLKASVKNVEEAWSLFNWVHDRRASDEISYIYINWRQGGSGGLAFRKADFPTALNYQGHILMEQDQRARYIVAHEMLHILLNAEHGALVFGKPRGPTDYLTEFNHIRMNWRNLLPEAGIYGSKRITKYKLGRQKDGIFLNTQYVK